MSTKVILFKDSNCDLCKVQQQELMDNPPAADLEIIHIKHEHNIALAEKHNISTYPTTILIEEDTDYEINRFEGFVDSKSIDININDYETKRMV